ncbi:cupin domain-containing protein [Eoetvoesiella caeni]|uniref:Cupin domain n=1 Tax=Eoetvoesiella caeni TaxID=645616 RepID=A0A366HJE4_9BURK|nr:cupin domain-containing protein [Eoetvoesiella caeni]MCI2807892.1 cupin domain-containing protein [Eoetvoesiella caeni]NYT54106.1 cupin domain-containing protein [Eoetvoesiella caeni]RBP41810.1 cupin domain [Eoetvoesiella caeni]
MTSTTAPKSIRRVVVGSKDGVPTVLSDASSVRTFEHLPTFSNTLIWTTPSVPKVGPHQLAADPVPSNTNFLPPPGGTSFMIVTFPPEAQMADPSFDGASFGAEVAAKVPGLAQTFEREDPTMHTTDTVDYGVVLEGEIWLDLGGEEVHLKQHDVVVQNGARHGWRNKSNNPVMMLFVLIGAQRQAS